MLMDNDRVYIVLWTTGRCNLQCKYCYAYSADHQTDMDFSTAKKALDLFGRTPMKIQFAGGEPLMNFDLIRQVYDYIKCQNYNAVLQLQTNGTLIDGKIAAELKKMNIHMGVSLDGSFGVNESLRGGTKLALDGIQNLARAGIVVNLNCVVSAANVERLQELPDLALYLGNVAGIGLDLVRYSGRASDAAVRQPEAEQLVQAVWALYEKCEFLHRNTGIRIGIRQIEEARIRLARNGCGGNYCYASCGKSYVILPDGDVYPCGSLKDRKEYYMGNINDGMIKSMALASPTKGEVCAACEYRDACVGGCPARAITNHQTLVTGSLDCVLRKTAFEIVYVGQHKATASRDSIDLVEQI
jgi:uncharacterized protein